MSRMVLAEHPLTPRAPWPWVPRQDEGVDQKIRRVIAGLETALSVSSRADFDHYGCGYASFVNAWFSRWEAAQHDTGLVVLFCRLAPCYCLLEAGSASCLPCFEAIDAFHSTPVERLACEVEQHLAAMGYLRLRRSDLAHLLPEGTTSATNLSNAPYRHFDALFNWED